MKNSLKEIFSGFWSLVTGMRITLGQFFQPTVTVHYPHESLKMPKRFRGHIELVRDPATGIAKCFVCKLCEKACPSDCITVEGIKPEGARRKTVTYYRLDFTKCSLCGSCVEACRDGAIRFSREFNLAGTNKDEYVMDLFKRLENERTEGERREGKPATQPAPQGPNGEVKGPLPEVLQSQPRPETPAVEQPKLEPARAAAAKEVEAK